MKKIKKIASILLSVIMTIAMAVPTMASNTYEPVGGAGNKFRITINNNSNPESPDGYNGTVAGHTFEAYQIFKGDVAKDTEGNLILSNIEWGNAINQTEGKLPDGMIEALHAVSGVSGLSDCTTAADFAEAIDNEKIAAAFAKAIDGFLTNKSGSVGPIEVGQKSASIEVTGAGYYLVKDADGSQANKDGSYTELILRVVNSCEITPKASVPTVKKEVEYAEDEWGSAADYRIGEEINYRLTGTLPSNYVDAFKSYKYVFTDKLSDGLDYVGNSANVYVVNKDSDKVDVTKSFNIEYDETTRTLKIGCNDLKKIEDASITATSEILVEYKAKLNKDAVTGGKGNENTVYLTFSNNPNGDGTGTGNTPEDKVTVFTFELDVNKTDDNNKSLEGAGFTLFKKNGNNWEKVQEIGSEKGKYIFEFKGLSNGDYKISETTTPAGYNTIDDIFFTVESKYTVDGVTTLTVTKVSGGGNMTAEKFSASEDSGKIETTVVNKKGSLLPSTGGIGTTIFYVIGAILVIGAGVLLVTKKRMSSK